MDRQLAIAWAVASTAVAIAVIAVVGSGVGLFPTEADPPATVDAPIDWRPVAAQPLAEPAPEIVYVDEPASRRRRHGDDDHEDEEEDEWDDD